MKGGADFKGCRRGGAAFGSRSVSLPASASLTSCDLASLSCSGREKCSLPEDGEKQPCNWSVRQQISGQYGAAATTLLQATSLRLTGVHVWVKALVGSFCGPNMGLAFSLSLSVCLYPRLAFATLLCSRGRRNSHTRHQVETSSAPLYFPVLNKQLLPFSHIHSFHGSTETV